MLRGLDRFKEHFAGFSDRYVLIGGTACTLVMHEAGLDFRSTKDLDIVLCIESLDAEFGRAFWEFIKKGSYQHRQKSTGKETFYRFYSPADQNFPEMLELFSRKLEAMTLHENSHLTPIPMEDEVSSLSAILLDGDYYEFIHAGKREIGGLPVIGHECLIPLKARAWLELSERRQAGGNVDEKDLRKHKNDVIRLYQLLSVQKRVVLSEIIKKDMRKFIECMKKGETIDLKNLGLKNTHLDEVLSNLDLIFSRGQTQSFRTGSTRVSL
jgi:hypothetical protein